MSTYAERMADQFYAAHVHGIVEQMPAVTVEEIRTVRALINAGRRQSARSAGSKAS